MGHTLLVPFNSGNRRGLLRPSCQPIQAGGLRVVVYQCDFFSVHSIVAGEIGRYRAFAAATLGIQEHYVTHFLSLTVLLLRKLNVTCNKRQVVN